MRFHTAPQRRNVIQGLYVNWREPTIPSASPLVLNLINSQKGVRLFELLRNDFVVVKKGLDEAIRGNRSLIKPWSANAKKDEFWSLYDKKGIEALIQYCQPFRISKKMKMDWFKQDHLWLIPKPVLKMILKKKS